MEPDYENMTLAELEQVLLKHDADLEAHIAAAKVRRKAIKDALNKRVSALGRGRSPKKSAEAQAQ